MTEPCKPRVLICGATGSIGKPLCRHLIEIGYSLVLCDIDKEGLVALVEELTSLTSTPPIALTMDIRDETSVKQVFDHLHDARCLPGAVVNTSYPRNKNYGHALEQVSLADFSENVSWHLGGYFALSKHACLGFKEIGGGSLVNISSIYGMMAPRFEIYRDTPMTVPVEYAAIKSSVLHLTRYFAQFYKKKGIRVNAVSPGGIQDKQPESFLLAYSEHCGTKGMLDSSDILGAIQFLISEDSRFITGQNLVVDDGFSL